MDTMIDFTFFKTVFNFKNDSVSSSRLCRNCEHRCGNVCTHPRVKPDSREVIPMTACCHAFVEKEAK